MKSLFIGILATLLLSTFATMYMNRERIELHPLLYWVTDNNPARVQQVNAFRSWLKKNNHPDIDLRVDTANSDVSKKIIQAVSGVAGDTIDCYPAGGELFYFKEAGFVEDITDDALKMGFDTSKTYPSLKEDICIDGRQYVFPCSANAQLLVMNMDAFKRIGVKPPKTRCSFEDFEKSGLEYVELANKSQARRDKFFCDCVPPLCVIRSLGGDIFNETMTKSVSRPDSFVKAFETLYKWTYKLHLMPTAAEAASFSSQSGYGGSSLQLFNSGNFAMVYYGRYALIQLRQFGRMDLDAIEVPNGGFPNSIIGARSEMVYKGSKRKNLAKLFLAYLASEEYNMSIVQDADSLPPNPVYTKTEAYLRPIGYENEWKLHEKFAGVAVDISIVQSKSSYVSNTLAYRFFNDGHSACMSGVLGAEDAVKDIQGRIDDEIARTVKENPKLAEAYQRDLETQNLIDEKLLKGEKIPLKLIKNPFHRKYYKETGIAE